MSNKFVVARSFDSQERVVSVAIVFSGKTYGLSKLTPAMSDTIARMTKEEMVSDVAGFVAKNLTPEPSYDAWLTECKVRGAVRFSRVTVKGKK